MDIGQSLSLPCYWLYLMRKHPISIKITIPSYYLHDAGLQCHVCGPGTVFALPLANSLPRESLYPWVPLSPASFHVGDMPHSVVTRPVVKISAANVETT